MAAVLARCVTLDELLMWLSSMVYKSETACPFLKSSSEGTAMQIQCGALEDEELIFV